MQKVEPPINPKAWVSWKASLADAKVIEGIFKKKGPEAKVLKGLGILQVAEAIEQAGVGMEDAKKAYRKVSGEEAKRRWAKVDVLVGTVAAALEEEEE